MDAPPTEHLTQEQLFPLLWAIKDRQIPREGEGADPELAKALGRLSESFQEELGAAHRLGPETVERLLAHTRACSDCRMKLIEDAPDARPPRTRADAATEVTRLENERAARVKRFWISGGIGLVTFIGGQVTFGVWRHRNREEVTKTNVEQLHGDPAMKAKRPIDPLIFLGIAVTAVAAFAIADAYVIARELWIDFTRWKRAVPVFGKKWAEGEAKARSGE